MVRHGDTELTNELDIATPGLEPPPVEIDRIDRIDRIEQLHPSSLDLASPDEWGTAGQA